MVAQNYGWENSWSKQFSAGLGKNVTNAVMPIGDDVHRSRRAALGAD
jgi:hypothetical protein